MDIFLIELNPNRLLLNPNFDGYKLALQDIPKQTKQLVTPVDRMTLKGGQYTLLHAKLYGLHNHLIGDPFDKTGSVYFTDTEWNICKTYIDPFNNELIDPLVIWQLPKYHERKTGDYNVSLKFVNENLAIMADGTGILHIINTGSRNDDNMFTSVFSDEVIGQDNGFVIIDVQTKLETLTKSVIHVLLQNIMQNLPEERYVTILHWVTFSKSHEQPWQQESLKQLKVTGDLQYAALEKDCSAVYVVGDGECKFTLNSDNPLISDKNYISENESNKYTWSQNAEDIKIKFVLPEEVNKELIFVRCESTHITVKYDENVLIDSTLHKSVYSNRTTWNLNNSYLEIVLVKTDSGLTWPQLINGNNDRSEETHSTIETHKSLVHLCTETKIGEQSGTTFNSQQLEECDFEADKIVTFERLCGTSNQVTHKVNLGSHQVLLTAALHPDLPPALGIRYDVDVCLWQPQNNTGNFSINHEGTLLAFGYVQASKQTKKFSVCSPDMSYSTICDSRHLFVYRQKIPICSNELKNRTTGRRVSTIAQQQVINISNDEVIGIYPTNKILFLLYESSVTALQL